ncbi:MAG: hypothetical protein NC180_10330 [Muribaculaceae bacterium]|nr:hypothetical protein [Roseburia sp.]MCM1431977.1 hypothetical protein [Muribaculaceae bacterium]MCM1493607.1 hypothetical protein [Muribaculaceae bacterium]
MKYSIRLETKDDYNKIGQLYEKAFDHREGMIKKYYIGFDEYLSFLLMEIMRLWLKKMIRFVALC